MYAGQGGNVWVECQWSLSPYFLFSMFYGISVIIIKMKQTHY